MADRDTPPTVARTLRVQHAGSWRFRVELPSLRLRVLSGPDTGQLATFCLPLIRIGGGRDNDLVLTDPTVSRRHAELTVGSEGVTIRDQGSTNGTWVGAGRLEEALLSPGGEFRLGDTRIQIEPVVDTRNSLVGEQPGLGELVGGSPPMRELYALLKAVAPTQATVLIQGETGTGKELVARTLHQLSGLSGPLVPFDCGAADPASIRSDLFGHQRGAFTGAESARKGAFREADGGTLFLDEIGELPLELQPRLLRALESRQVTPMGADRAVPVRVRVVTATHRDLAAMVAAREFRADLYHRLAIIQVATPPLRQRRGDIPLLAAHLLAQVAPGVPLADSAIQVLEAHPWPGNVRQLRNALEQGAALSGGHPIAAAHLRLDRLLPPELPHGAPASAVTPEALPLAAAEGPRRLEDLEREQIRSALERNFWNQTAAAKELGISRSTLKRRLKQFGLKG